MDEGWTRWLLEQYEFGYRNITNTDMRTGNLSDYDIIIFADEGESQIFTGHRAGAMPEQYVGGVGPEGVAKLKQFVEAGGTMMAWDGSVDFAISALGLPLKNSVRGVRNTEFFIPGTLLRIETRPTHRLAVGMEPEAVAMFNSSIAIEAAPAPAGSTAGAADVFVEYAKTDFLVSGWELGGETYLAGKMAGVRVPVGRGQAVVYGFRPAWRGQPHNTFKLLFNPLYAATQR
jgi:hypothetical protein